MEFKSQTNQSAAAPSQASRPVAEQQRTTGTNNSGGGRKLLATIVSLLVVVALAIAGLFLWQSQTSGDTAKIDANKYQAVFMTNGQVYFGHLASLKGEYVELTDIYYLQVQQDVQPSAGNKNATNDNSKVSLTKLGNELHGPTDKMNISKDQVLFWEDLKDDSSVVKAIQDSKNK